MKFDPHERKLVLLTSNLSTSKEPCSQWNSFDTAPISSSFDSKFALQTLWHKEDDESRRQKHLLLKNFAWKYPRTQNYLILWMKGIGTEERRTRKNGFGFKVETICSTNTFEAWIVECPKMFLLLVLDIESRIFMNKVNSNVSWKFHIVGVSRPTF